MLPRISVVINTMNEEKNLPYALKSVRSWANEIIVVDMHSEDGTTEVARRFGAKVYVHERLGFVEPARAFAVSRASGDWILLLDADELIPRPLSIALRDIAHKDEADVVGIPMLNYLFGGAMMHTAVGPTQNTHLRFFKPGYLLFTERLHDRRRPVQNARVLRLNYNGGHAIVHFAYCDFAAYLDKVNRYTTIEAEQASKLEIRPGIGRALASALKAFIRYYLFGKGYRDGWRGFYFSAGSAFYRVALYAKLTGIKSSTGEASAIYQQEAERLLREYRE